MQLVHKETQLPAKVGDKVTSFRGIPATIVSFSEPHKPSSIGKVYVQVNLGKREYYVSVYDLEWIDREDR